MIPLFPDKDIFDVLPYSYDFTPWVQAGDVITHSVVIASPVGLTLSAPIIQGGFVTTIVSGGTLGVDYELSFEITTLHGWSVKRSGTVSVVDR
jgi:hypothetical protein